MHSSTYSGLHSSNFQLEIDLIADVEIIIHIYSIGLDYTSLVSSQYRQ